MSKNIKADLSLLNKLVAELSVQLDLAYAARDSMNASQLDEQYQTFIVEISKSVGILSGIASEVSLLVGDLRRIMQFASKAPQSDDAENLIKTIMAGVTKGKGGMRN